MSLFQILILSIVQGAAELLPVSSSAHVIVTEKLMGLDPTSPDMTLLLAMLHTGTMFAVIAYFWKSWRSAYFSSAQTFRFNMLFAATATAMTGIVGVVLMELIKHVVAGNASNFEVEQLFGNSRLMAGALAAAGILIILSSRLPVQGNADLSIPRAAWIGIIQGLCLPFRGFSRSGATISTGLVLGMARRHVEEFSFLLAVVLTPAVIAREAYRLFKAHATSAIPSEAFAHIALFSIAGMIFSFAAGWLALRWLSQWLEQGRWHFFGVYCLFASLIVLWVG